MKSLAPIYNLNLNGHNLKLRFISEESPTKMGINMQFVMETPPEDPRDKQELANKISVILQKKFGDAGIAVAFNDRNPYKNVISFIIPIDSISKVLVDVLKN
jgi:hypothetical protein